MNSKKMFYSKQKLDNAIDHSEIYESPYCLCKDYTYAQDVSSLCHI